MESWVELSYEEIDEVWDEFDSRFDFRPNENDFPTIIEPIPSLTFDVSHAIGGKPIDIHLVDAAILCALRECTETDKSVYFLDWQHMCYRFYPHLAECCDENDGGLPFGDYSIFVAEDFSFGIYGEPHEHSVCLFGPKLIAELAPRLKPIFNVLREKTA